MTSWTTEQLQAIEKALAEGVRRVKYQDKEVEYRSLEEMMTLRDAMRRDLGLVPSGSFRTVGVYSSGL